MCAANRYDNAPTCPCENGYYENPTTFACIVCPTKCATCAYDTTTELPYCLTCAGLRATENHETAPECPCPDAYYSHT